VSRSGGVSVNTDHYRRSWDAARERALARRSEVSAAQRARLAAGIAEFRAMLAVYDAPPGKLVR
jgi:hypothetical protein